MANNTQLPGTGEIYSSDEVENAAGVDVNFQKIKIVHGNDGSEPVSVSNTSPMPITDLGEIANLGLKLDAVIFLLETIANLEHGNTLNMMDGD